jgi:putative DNA primase/helicase
MARSHKTNRSTATQESSTLTCALQFLSQGIPVIPLRPSSKSPAFKGGVNARVTEQTELREIFQHHPDYNYGIVTGTASNILGLDIDGPRGRQSLKKLMKKHGPLPMTVTTTTARGHHRLFRIPGDTSVPCSAGKLGKGLDVRGDSGYLVGPGSTHPSGATYGFKEGRSPDDLKIAEAPGWLVDLARAPKTGSPSERPQTALRTETAETLYVAAAVKGEIDAVRHSTEGSRNARLNRAAFRLGQFVGAGQLTEAVAYERLTNAARETGLEDEEIAATISSGLGSGRRKSAEPSKVAGRDNDLSRKLASLGETDTDNARRFAKRCRGLAMFTSGQGWFFWDNKKWTRDDQNKIKILGMSTVAQIIDEAPHLEREGDRSARVNHAEKSKSRASIDNMLALAAPMLQVADAKLDRNKWLLNCRNGTVDLRTGKLRPHNSKDRITKIIGLNFLPGAKCPRFRKFLQQVTRDDRELRLFLRRAVGYSLTGETREQVFFFLIGVTQNGKSTFVNLIRCLLGEYGLHTPTETLLVKQYDNAIPADLARLKGARMVTAIEANVGRQLDEARIKAMTGGEPITARFMRQDFFEFTPEFRLWFVANDFPRVRGTADAFWRRVLVVPFDADIRAPDDRLMGKLKAEAAGILAWAVRGCLAWQKHGLQPPAAVASGSNRWRKIADHVTAFVKEACVLEPTARTASSAIYSSYQDVVLRPR